jgi:hypothetical protein
MKVSKHMWDLFCHLAAETVSWFIPIIVSFSTGRLCSSGAPGTDRPSEDVVAGGQGDGVPVEQALCSPRSGRQKHPGVNVIKLFFKLKFATLAKLPKWQED